MSQTTKTVLGIAAVAVVLAGIYFYWQQHRTGAPLEEGTEVTTLPTGSDTSDTSLEEDLAAIDSQLQAATTDTAEANGSIDAATQ